MRTQPSYIDTGDTVFFNRGFGVEHGTVWTTGSNHVAIGIGHDPRGNPIERTVLPKADVYQAETSVPTQ